MGIRDSDKYTFTGRIREGYHFLYANHPGYKLYIFDEFGYDRMNCTEHIIKNQITALAPVTNMAIYQWAVFSGSMVLLETRAGCLITAIHAATVGFFMNMYQIRQYLLDYFVWTYKDGTPTNGFVTNPAGPSPCFPEHEFDEK